jgi:hypothetical protein
MKSGCVPDTLSMLPGAQGFDSRNVEHPHWLLSVTGSSCIAGDEADLRKCEAGDCPWGVAASPEAEQESRVGKGCKSCVLLESLIDVSVGRAHTILLDGKRTMRDPIKARRLQHRGKVA